MVEPHVRDLIILSATTLVFVLTLYILSLRVARQHELEAQLDDARAEIACTPHVASPMRPAHPRSSLACACARSPSIGSRACAWPRLGAPASPIPTGFATIRYQPRYGR